MKCRREICFLVMMRPCRAAPCACSRRPFRPASEYTEVAQTESVLPLDVRHITGIVLTSVVHQFDQQRCDSVLKGMSEHPGPDGPAPLRRDSKQNGRSSDH